MTVHTKHQRKHAKLVSKFAKFAIYNGMIDEGGEFAKTGRQAKKASNQHWTKRHMQAGDMHKRSNAKPSLVHVVQH